MAEIVVLGGGGHAKVLIGLLKKTDWTILGFTDADRHAPILGVPYLGVDTALSTVIAQHPRCSAIVGVGKVDTSDIRERLARLLLTLGFACPVIVSPQAVVNEEVRLGAGTAVFDGVVVNSGTITGDHCILNTNSTVEHDCRLGTNVHVAPGAVICGGVKLGDRCMIGAGATVIQDVAVCAGSLIGAGSTVAGKINDPGVYAGNPARRIK